MRLLIVTQSVDREDPNLGAFYYWFEALAQRVESLCILARHVGTPDLPVNTDVYSFDTKGGGRVGRIWRFWTLFSHHFARSDTVLFHQIPEFVLAASPFLFAQSRSAALWYAHGSVPRRLRWAERMVDYVFTSSPDGFRLPSKKVFHLGQAINTEFFFPSASIRLPHSPNGLSLVTIGRLAPVKNYEVIINACAILRRNWQRAWTLSIIGGPLTASDRAYAARLKELVREKGLAGEIHFYGEHRYSEIPAILRDHDIFLNASRTGSLDKAVLEAMACGLTVLTSNQAYRSVLPAPYFLQHLSPEFLAARIQALADEPRPNIALREIVVREHALEQTVGRLVDILRETL